MNHNWMMLVLVHLAESGSTESGKVAESFGISSKHAGMTLLRCYRRKFVSRRLYRRGRVRGYVYRLTDKGAEWMFHKATPNKRRRRKEYDTEVEVGNEIVQLQRFQPLISKHTHQMDEPLPIEWVIICSLYQRVGDLVQENKSLKDFLDIVLVTLSGRTDERDFVYYLYRRLQEKEKSAVEPQNREEISSSDSYLKGWIEGRNSGVKLGRAIGISIGVSRELINTQVLINKIISKRILVNVDKQRKANSSLNKLLLQHKQK